MFRRSKIYYRVGSEGEEKVMSDSKVLPEGFFEREVTKAKEKPKSSFREYFGIVVAPKLAVVADVVVDIAALAGIAILMIGGISKIIDNNGTDC